MSATTEPIVKIHHASLQFGDRKLWTDLTLTLDKGEFLAVLGPNGSGKSSLLKVLLGLYQLTEGTASVSGNVGYVPQQRAFDADLPIRGRDLVGFGLDGTEWGFASLSSSDASRVDAVISEVGASDYADRPIGRLSGGEQQRLRIAQALVNDPAVLLCDEPLLSLDLASQKAVAELINTRRKQGGAVVFVTHEINPIMQYVDRVLYLVEGKWKLGSPQEVLTSESLSALYDTDVDVLRVRGRVIVVSNDESTPTEPTGHHHPHNGSHV
jgi:zinc/manganese transport system ATP-binding protein